MKCTWPWPQTRKKGIKLTNRLIYYKNQQPIKDWWRQHRTKEKPQRSTVCTCSTIETPTQGGREEYYCGWLKSSAMIGFALLTLISLSSVWSYRFEEIHPSADRKICFSTDISLNMLLKCLQCHTISINLMKIFHYAPNPGWHSQ